MRRAFLGLALTGALALAGVGIHQVEASHPIAPLNLVQFNGDMSALSAGGMTAGSMPDTVILQSDVGSPTCGGSYTHEYEVREVGQAFTGSATSISAPFTPTCSQVPTPPVTVGPLSVGTQYKWQCRENAPGGFSAWVQFAGGSAAFEISGSGGAGPAVPAASTTSLIATIVLLFGASLFFMGKKSS